MIRSVDEIFEKLNILEIGNPYVSAFIRRDWRIGESREDMIKRLEYDSQLKSCNEKIQKNLYTIADLELVE
ncbi:MAG: hypothetical protein Lokiarch_11240 [Candidatus Lokiarchaeum sp. GC14_75]|nr:MAG: hypothetical protein Lokiarch_11240 [Candidatus Lokiarchaeum sp. GC14_75]